jgi:hypothetical protein
LNSSGRILGRGSLFVTGNLNNTGTVALSGGFSDIDAPLLNNGTVIVTGGSTSTFYGNVNNGTATTFRVSTASTAVFIGDVVGASAFSGPGIKDFEGAVDGGAIASAIGTTIVRSHANVGSIHDALLHVGGVAQILPDGTSAATSRVNALEIEGAADAWTGKFDLADNALVIDYASGDPSPLATVQNQIKQGFAGGAWTGNGLTSLSAAAVAAGSDAHKNALGFAEASAIGVTTFRGQSVDSTAVLVRYTYSGDANLDGVVDTLDFNALAANFGGAGKVWAQADFNFDAVVDTLDFNNLAANFGQSLPESLSESLPESALATGALVPEPGAALWLPLIVAAHWRRRRIR